MVNTKAITAAEMSEAYNVESRRPFQLVLAYATGEERQRAVDALQHLLDQANKDSWIENSVSLMTGLKCRWLRDKSGMVPCGVIMIDEQGRRALVDMGQVSWTDPYVRPHNGAPFGIDKASQDVMNGLAAVVQALPVGELSYNVMQAMQHLDYLTSGQIPKLESIIASMYIIAGDHSLPEHILDILSDPNGASADAVEDMIPYTRPVPTGWKVTRCEPNESAEHAAEWELFYNEQFGEVPEVLDEVDNADGIADRLGNRPE